ncbi:hypothetical protein NDU88_002798 [Pleurodeles waltl]|uniref:Uncharacterized protein n=1 Tax=Pleurodeles waltl TaxID=8319 RepID=A0AAV7T4P6_PLEWA|nr:hypothetical protein NDU88_002798 [Pleurodeles waltl]
MTGGREVPLLLRCCCEDAVRTAREASGRAAPDRHLRELLRPLATGEVRAERRGKGTGVSEAAGEPPGATIEDCRRQKRNVRKLEREYKKTPSTDIKEKPCQAQRIYKALIRQRK